MAIRQFHKRDRIIRENISAKTEKCIDILSYYDAVKAALCFGWIDSTLKNIDGELIQRFSPRKKKSHWTETNIKRCIELDQKGLMREEGKRACPAFNL